MTRDVLAPSELAQALVTLPRWELADGALTTTVVAADFSEAFAFMTRVAMAAEQAEHHPDWSNVWATVKISLHTHDVGGITNLDLELARRIDGFRPDR